MVRKIGSGLLIGVGYMLSPLSWWNDLFFNLPIALVFGYAARWFHPDWLVAGTIVGYWISNVLGIVMMQVGAMELLVAQEQRNFKRDLVVGLGGSTAYTVVIAALAYFHVLRLPDFLPHP